MIKYINNFFPPKIIYIYIYVCMYIYVRHVVKQRNRMLRKVRDVPGLVGDVVVGAPEEGREASKIMTPRLWFWHKFYMRPLAEDENKTLCANDFVRRVRGRELADGE